MPHNTLFAPLITLVLWTFVMWAWLFPAIRKNRIPLDPLQSKEAFNAQNPAAGAMEGGHGAQRSPVSDPVRAASFLSSRAG
jgi:hypothetical protein